MPERSRSLLALCLFAGLALGATASAQAATKVIESEKPQARMLTRVELLMAGAQAGRLDVVVYFLNKGVSADVVSENGFTALMIAAGKGHKDIAELLLARGAKVNYATGQGWTALMEAAYRDRDELVRRLLKAGAKVNVREARRGLTPLMIAARGDKSASLAALLAADASVNDADRRRGLTALHYALGSRKKNAPEIAAELLVHGADASLAAKDGYTPLMAAAGSGELAKLSLLLSEKIDVNAEALDGRSALSISAGYGHLPMVKRLLRAGARLDGGEGKQTVLSEAVRGGVIKVVELLLEKGADPNRPGSLGKTPLILAAARGDQAMVGALLQKGAAVDGRNPRDGTTALMWAANNGRKAVVQALMARGANSELTAKDGWTAAAAARMAGHEDIARLFEERI